MDASLRHAERSGEPLALARDLRRRGLPERARRVLADAARAGHRGAREALEAEHPLPAEVTAALAALEAEHPPNEATRTGALIPLLGAWDPRIDEALGRFLGRHPSPPPAVRDGDALRAALAAPDLPARLQALVRGWRDGAAIGRAWLEPDEALAVHAELLRLPEEPDPWPGGRLLRVCAAWLLGVAGDGRARAPAEAQAAVARSWIERLECARTLRALGGEAPDPTILAARPARPSWVPSASPGSFRDPLTGALGRRLHHTRASPLLGGAWRWAFMIDIDGLRRCNDRYGLDAGDYVLLSATCALQELVGDRVLRWSGQQFLVFWEGEEGRAVGERLRSAVARAPIAAAAGVEAPPRVTATVGAAQPGPPRELLQRLETGLARGKAAGGDRVVLA